jgi:hypothetical protein
MGWSVRFDPAFKEEVLELPRAVRVELIASIAPLENLGPLLGRPDVDTLNGSRYTNMKELRFRADGGVWRVAFAFDPERAAILLVGGDKSDDWNGWYTENIPIADQRLEEHQAKIEEERAVERTQKGAGASKAGRSGKGKGRTR